MALLTPARFRTTQQSPQDLMSQITSSSIRNLVVSAESASYTSFGCLGATRIQPIHLLGAEVLTQRQPRAKPPRDYPYARPPGQ